MAKHHRGSLGTPASVINPRSSEKARRRKEALVKRQQRLSGPCETVYDRDQGVGAVPENLKEQ
jgi:hypothetical protein